MNIYQTTQHKLEAAIRFERGEEQIARAYNWPHWVSVHRERRERFEAMLAGLWQAHVTQGEAATCDQ